MLPRRSYFAVALLVPILASCAGQDIPPYQTAKSDAMLSERLAGRVVGPAVSCLPVYRSNDMEVIDGDTILFRDGRTTYRQDTRGSCYPRGSSVGYALVTRSFSTGGRLCAGDIAQVLDTTSGFFVGSCSFNRFVPYRRAS